MSWLTNLWKYDAPSSLYPFVPRFRNTPYSKLDGNTPKEEFKLEAQIFRRKALYVLLHPCRWYRLQQLKREFRVGVEELPGERGSVASDSDDSDDDSEYGGGGIGGREEKDCLKSG
ncbi:hypothetical protein EDC01DRAFT_631073 [Geopyxis carbonaria]|nr:hypothetical protein EDC01DRAFT_631073 [Geopyxis carbonaria]